MAEFLEMILAQLIGNISTALIVVIFYFNFLLFESYLRLIVWAILFSQALRQAKNNVVSVLQYLSDHPDVPRYGLLTCVFSKSCHIFFYHPADGSRRSYKELFLNYGAFVFSLLGAISIWLRFSPAASILHFWIGCSLVCLSILKLLDRRVFYYRYFISDEVLVSTCLIIGFFSTAFMVVLYLGTESYLEGSRAATDLSHWVQTNFINDERTRQIWSEQVEQGREMLSAGFSSIEDNYNHTMWWPPFKSLVKAYYIDAKYDTDMPEPSLYSRLSLPENLTFFDAITLAYTKVDGVNLTSVQLTDWTSKGLEVSSIAFGSVLQLLLLVCTLVIAFVSMGIRAVFFQSSLFYLLCTKWDPIERFVEDLLPIQSEKKPQVLRSLRKVIEGVFFLPLKMASIHALVTLLSFSIVGVDFLYLAASATFFLSLVPIMPPYLVCVPWAVSIGISSSFIKAVVLFGVQYVAFTMLDDMLYEKSIVAVNSYVSALSAVFGVYVFGFEGVIFGPLLVCGVYFTYEVSNHGIQAAQDDHMRSFDDLHKPLDESADESSQEGSPRRDPTPSGSSDTAFNSNNIFSDAMYRVISAPLVDRVRRRFSMDISTEESCVVTFVIEGLRTSKKVRFVVDRSWSMRRLQDAIKHKLHVQAVESILSEDDEEILSPMHIMPHETLHVKVKPRARTTESVSSEVHVTLPHHTSVPSLIRNHSKGSKEKASALASVSSPVMTKKMGHKGSTAAPTIAQDSMYRRKSTSGAAAKGDEPMTRRRSSCSSIGTDRKLSTVMSEESGVGSFEDVSPHEALEQDTDVENVGSHKERKGAKWAFSPLALERKLSYNSNK